MPFDDVCPSGWTRVSAFDNNFLRGSSTSGGTGGNSEHTHTFDPASKQVSYSLVHSSDWGPDEISHLNQHYHTINIPSTVSGPAEHIPPYINVVFCKKD